MRQKPTAPAPSFSLTAPASAHAPSISFEAAQKGAHPPAVSPLGAERGASLGTKKKLPGGTVQRLPKNVSQKQIERLVKLFQAGKYNELLKKLPPLLKKAPDLLPLWDLKGAAHRKLGAPDKALACFKKSLKIGADTAETHLNIGAVLCDMKRFSEAKPYLEQALERAPENPIMANALGLCLNECGRHFETITLLSPWVEGGNANGSLLNTLGVALYNLSFLDEAAACHSAVSAPEEECAQAQYRLGTIAKARGAVEQAQNHYLQAIQIDPKRCSVHRSLSTLIKYTSDHPHLATLELLNKQRDLDVDNQIEISFALFKAYHDLKEHDVAFRHLQKGNRLKEQAIGYTLGNEITLLEYLKGAFVDPSPVLDVETPFRPIFIVGLPRSGTTLAEQILSGCDNVVAAGELPYAASAMADLLRDLQTHKKQSPSPDQILALRRGLTENFNRHCHGKPVLIDKMPLNFRWVGPLAAAFPEALFIHTTRPALDNCWAVYKQCFQGAGNGYAYNFNTAVQYEQLCADLMQHWNTLLPGRIHHLDHSALVNEPEKHIRTLVDFCQLPWSEDCLHPHERKRSVLTASDLQVREPIRRRETPDWFPYKTHLAQITPAFQSELT